MSDEREYIMAFTMQEDGRFALEFNTLGKSAVREVIVRCCDCKWFDGDMSCDKLAICAGPDGFCAWGERRDA